MKAPVLTEDLCQVVRLREEGTQALRSSERRHVHWPCSGKDLGAPWRWGQEDIEIAGSYWRRVSPWTSALQETLLEKKKDISTGRHWKKSLFCPSQAQICMQDPHTQLCNLMNHGFHRSACERCCLLSGHPMHESDIICRVDILYMWELLCAEWIFCVHVRYHLQSRQSIHMRYIVYKVMWKHPISKQTFHALERCTL